MSMYLSGVTWPLPCSTRYLCTEIFMCCLRDVAGSLPWHVTRWCWCFMHQASPGSLTPSFSTKLSTGPSTKPHALIGHQIQSEHFSLADEKKVPCVVVLCNYEFDTFAYFRTVALHCLWLCYWSFVHYTKISFPDVCDSVNGNPRCACRVFVVGSKDFKTLAFAVPLCDSVNW